MERLGAAVRFLMIRRRTLNLVLEEVAWLHAELDATRAEMAASQSKRDMLTDAERAELARHWSQVVCSFCGGYHPGVCNRVRSVEMDEYGRPRMTRFWRVWQPAPSTIWPEDVWPSIDRMAADLESQVLERQGRGAMERAVRSEAERASAPRRRSPRAIMGEVIGDQSEAR